MALSRLSKSDRVSGFPFLDKKSGIIYRDSQTYVAHQNGFVSGMSVNGWLSVFGGVICCIAFILIFDLLSGGSSGISSLTFERFLNKLGDVSKFHIPTDWINGITLSSVFSEEWPLLDGLRQVLIAFVDFFRFSIQMSVGLANVFAFVIGLVGMFFTLS